MPLRMLAAAAAVLAATISPASAEPIELQWWHAMTAINLERVNKLAADFNALQTEYKVTPVYKGSYPETMTAAIAAFRAGTPPHIVQVFEAGTATMMAAKGAVKPVYQLMADAGEPFDPQNYLPTVTGYYSTADGKMLSLPFNSSTAIVYWNKDTFTKAGLDSEKPPKTWPETFAIAKKLKAGGANCGVVPAWITWTQIEQFDAWHNLPLATKANGLDGVDTELKFNTPIMTKHIAALAEAIKDKSFDYGGRTNEAEGRFISGDCPMIQTSSGFYGNVKTNAKFAFGMTELPYYPDIAGAPQNSIIGGASLWVMGGKKPEEYKGVAKFFSYLSRTDVQREMHEVTGYLPITKAAYEATKAAGFYEKNPGREIPLLQLAGKSPTENSRGLRLGNLVQIRDVIAEDLEGVFAGKSEPKAALDDAAARGNAILRQFQKNIQ
ncbi:MAG: sn-glycerol-3-phosphate ABC transporter substrate-binding protein UgpB [Alphaproteobacteria bacterium]|nr:MAG: sn-glycerol-3-phosphate ABC transporter substrate-binding protein UgpB [Alphaproteobacteria bacterium]